MVRLTARGRKEVEHLPRMHEGKPHDRCAFREEMVAEAHGRR